MHDFTAASIRFSMPSPADPSERTRVLVSLAHVVRLVPYYFLENGGRRMVTAVAGDDDAEARRQGLKRSFTVYDDLGGHYDAASATPAGQALLERLWSESA
jgi:hypothetical protein